MIRKLSAIVIGALILLLAGCSGSTEDEEKGAIAKATEKTGKEMAQAIQKPLDMAQKAAVLTEQHNRTVEEAEKGQ